MRSLIVRSPITTPASLAGVFSCLGDSLACCVHLPLSRTCQPGSLTLLMCPLSSVPDVIGRCVGVLRAAGLCAGRVRSTRPMSKRPAPDCACPAGSGCTIQGPHYPARSETAPERAEDVSVATRTGVATSLAVTPEDAARVLSGDARLSTLDGLSQRLSTLDHALMHSAELMACQVCQAAMTMTREVRP